MRVAIASAILGIAWGVLAFLLAFMHGYGRFSEFKNPEWFCAALVAGLAAGAFTAWTRHEITKSPIREFLSTLVTYYLAVCIWWATLGIVIGLRMGISPNLSGSYYDLGGHFESGYAVLFYATLYGPFLVPLCFLSRELIRWVVKRSLVDARPL